MIPPVPVATHETKPDIISSGAGLAAAVALESGPELGEGTEPVRARGYWEQVWIRFRKDKIAIAGGVFIILIILAGFIGAPIAAHSWDTVPAISSRTGSTRTPSFPSVR